MSYLYSKKSIRWDLQFVDKALEIEYSKSKERYQYFFLNIIILFGFLVGILPWVINPMNRSDQYEGKTLVFKLSLLLLLILVFILGSKKPKWRETLLTLTVIMLFVGMMESTQTYRQTWNEIMFFLAGINIEFASLPIVLGKISWKVTICLSLLTNLMNLFRYTNFDRNNEMNFYPVYHFIQNSIMLSISAFFVEKFDRESFFRIKSYEFSLSRFKDLVSSFFPNAIIIIKERQLIFYNNETLAALECTYEDEVLKVLEKFKLEVLKDKTGVDSLDTEEARPFTKRLISFDDLIIKTEKENFSSLNSLYGIYEIRGKIKNFEIKTTHIVWDDEKAFMILISESKVVEKINIISEESEYKDKLLANVSHDLRTPLNGISGMIRIAYDLVSDAATKK